MTAEHKPPASPGKPSLIGQWSLAGLTLAVFCLTWWACHALPEASLGPSQPIPFSHRVHAGVKHVSCLLCHNTVQAGPRAGIPPVETCMLCHSRVIITYPYIKLLRSHYYDDVPLLWNRVNELPDYVKFNHSQHINRSVDCGHCHGNVREMDRIKQPQLFTMGFCMKCHKAYNATHDCFTCHR